MITTTTTTIDLIKKINALEAKVDSHTKDIELDDNRIQCLSSRVLDLEYAARKKEVPEKTPEYSVEVKNDISTWTLSLCSRVSLEKAMAEIKQRSLVRGEHYIIKLLE